MTKKNIIAQIHAGLVVFKGVVKMNNQQRHERNKEIIRQHLKDKVPIKELAKRYGVSVYAIEQAVWRHRDEKKKELFG